MPVLGDFTIVGGSNSAGFNNPITVGADGTSTQIGFGAGGCVTNATGLVSMMIRRLNRSAVANVRLESQFSSIASDESLLGVLEGVGDDLQDQWFHQQFKIRTNLLSPGDGNANVLHLGAARLHGGTGNVVEYEVRDIAVFFHQSS